MANYIYSISYRNSAGTYDSYYLKAQTLLTVDDGGNNRAENLIPMSNGSGGTKWSTINIGVDSIGGQQGTIGLGIGLQMDVQSSSKSIQCVGMAYSQSKPTSNNLSGYRVAILSKNNEPTGEPSDPFYTGWLYYILEQ